MKKKISLLSILFLISFLAACNAKEAKTEDDGQSVVYLTGIIEEIVDLTAVVSSEYGRVFVTLPVDSSRPFQVGDEVKVGFNGEMMESSPAQIETISVDLVE